MEDEEHETQELVMQKFQIKLLLHALSLVDPAVSTTPAATRIDIQELEKYLRALI